MKITRRHFLGVSTGAAALFSGHAAAGGSGIFLDRRGGVVLHDLNSQCILGESLSGFKKILGASCVTSVETLPQAIAHAATIIVPGAGVMDAAVAQMLGHAVRQGSVLLLESGGGFLSADQFSAHQQVLQRHWNVRLEPPVDLWAGAAGKSSHPPAALQSRHKVRAHGPAPYVDYVWPHRAKVRDFSRVVPLAAQDGDVIGVAGKLTVAIKKRVGKGTLIFLGSPLGPHLHAGDPEACRWLRSVLAA